MKRFFAPIIVAILAITSLAVAADENFYTIKKLTAKKGGGLQVSINADRTMHMSEIEFVPIGHNPEHKRFTSSGMNVYSAVLHDNSELEPGPERDAEALAFKLDVVKGKASVVLPDPTDVTGEPMVEHFWMRSIGTNPGLSIMLVEGDPNNPWIGYQLDDQGRPDKQKLAVSLVYYPKNKDYPKGIILPLKYVLKVKGITGQGIYHAQNTQVSLNLSYAQMQEALALLAGLGQGPAAN